ncbi:complexin-3-like [Crotalus adamanteus]|uniref:Complexin-3-like n=1 Tax=Crotalus adamanteus TaxID=8729 RepID=A0AAW1AM68_CROAD
MDQGKPVFPLVPDLHLKNLSRQDFNHPLGTFRERRREKLNYWEIFPFLVPNGLFSTRLLSLTMRSGFGDAVRQLLCGLATDSTKEKDMGVQRSHSWEPVKMKAPPRQKADRDAAFARQKAQRASLRSHLREKYHLPKNPADEKPLGATGGKSQLPRDLLSILQPNGAWPVPSTFPNFGGIDLKSLQTTLQSPGLSFPRPGQCRIM